MGWVEYEERERDKEKRWGGEKECQEEMGYTLCALVALIFMPTAFLADGHIVLPGILNFLFISFSISLYIYLR